MYRVYLSNMLEGNERAYVERYLSRNGIRPISHHGLKWQVGDYFVTVYYGRIQFCQVHHSYDSSDKDTNELVWIVEQHIYQGCCHCWCNLETMSNLDVVPGWVKELLKQPTETGATEPMVRAKQEPIVKAKQVLPVAELATDDEEEDPLFVTAQIHEK
jgi:hypothetical protein